MRGEEATNGEEAFSPHVERRMRTRKELKFQPCQVLDFIGRKLNIWRVAGLKWGKLNNFIQAGYFSDFGRLTGIFLKKQKIKKPRKTVIIQTEPTCSKYIKNLNFINYNQ
jgi:hypothetical protein